ncbi:unnamed protein product, partial [Rotaria sordida]
TLLRKRTDDGAGCYCNPPNPNDCYCNVYHTNCGHNCNGDGCSACNGNVDCSDDRGPVCDICS